MISLTKKCFLYLACCCFFSFQVFADETVNAPSIGLVLPLTGDWAFLGQGIRDGALLAQKDLLNKGQVVNLRFEDNQGDLAASLAIGKKLVGVDKVDALISIISGVGKILKPIAHKAGIINIGICSETEVADGQHSFINYLTAEQGVSKYIERLGPSKKIGLYYLNESGFNRIVQVLKQQTAAKVQIAYQEPFEKGVTDFRPVLLKRKREQVDVFLILGLSPEIELLVKQARSLGIQTAVTSIEGFGLADDKTPFEGAWFIDSAVPQLEFQRRFQETYGRELTPGVGHAYDSVMLLAKSFASGIGNDGRLKRAKVAASFERIDDFEGVTGHLKVQPNGVIWSHASVKVIKNGKAEIENAT